MSPGDSAEGAERVESFLLRPEATTFWIGRTSACRAATCGQTPDMLKSHWRAAPGGLEGVGGRRRSEILSASMRRRTSSLGLTAIVPCGSGWKTALLWRGCVGTEVCDAWRVSLLRDQCGDGRTPVGCPRIQVAMPFPFRRPASSLLAGNGVTIAPAMNYCESAA